LLDRNLYLVLAAFLYTWASTYGVWQALDKLFLQRHIHLNKPLKIDNLAQNLSCIETGEGCQQPQHLFLTGSVDVTRFFV